MICILVSLNQNQMSAYQKTNQVCLGLVQVARETWLKDLACVFTGHQAELSLSIIKSNDQIHCHT